MECDQVRLQLSAWLDQELPEKETTAISAHIAACTACRVEWEGLCELDRRLACAITLTDVEARVAEVERAISKAILPVRSRWSRRLRNWSCVASAAAAGLAAAIWIFRTDSEPSLPVVGRLVRATDNVVMWLPHRHKWVTVSSQEPAPVPQGAMVRTGSNVLCEIETTQKNRIRVDESAEICLRDTARVELLKGQIWCATSNQSELVVEVADRVADDPNKKWQLVCSNSSEIHVKSDSSQITCSTGKKSDCTMNQGAFCCPVAANETVSIDAQRSVERIALSDIDKIWQIPLLVQGSIHTDELRTILVPVLTLIGQSKNSKDVESQLRRLGPDVVTALLVFVESEPAAPTSDSGPRHTAMRIAAEMASTRVFPQLRRLMHDADPRIAQLAAEAFERLQ